MKFSLRLKLLFLQVLGNFITFAAAIYVIIEADTIDPSQVGLIITYALSVTQVLNWLVRMTADVETNIVAVERIKVKLMLSKKATKIDEIFTVDLTVTKY